MAPTGSFLSNFLLSLVLREIFGPGVVNDGTSVSAGPGKLSLLISFLCSVPILKNEKENISYKFHL